jgi:tetratricopeptide (TPR) repeat protein
MQHSLVSVFTPSLMSAEDLEHIFVQREPLAKDLVKRIVNSTKGSGKEHSLLIGMRGMGKTHMVSLVYHRIRSIPEIQDKILIAWLREEEWGVDSWLDLVMRIFRSITEDRNSADGNVAQELLDKLRQGGLENAKELATRFLRDLIGKRTLVLIIENMDDLFQGLGEIGQQKFRAFLQEYRCCTVLATTPALFKGVTSREVPFFGFFHRSFLESIEVDEAVKMLGQIASLNTVRDDHHDLAVFLQSAQGRARVRAVHHLAGGNPRVYTLFAQFMTRESLDDLVDAFMKMLDDLTPYYQARMKELSNQQRKIVELLVDRRQAVMVKDIGDTCFIDQRAVASQLRELKKKGYVVSNEVGRESFYELREVLMRFCMEVKKFRGRWVELIVDFLKIWYRPEHRRGMLDRFSDSNLISRNDLERAFLSEDDPVGIICIKEFQRSLKEKNQSLALQLTEELYSCKIITDTNCYEFTSLIRDENYHTALLLARSMKLSVPKNAIEESYCEFLSRGLKSQESEEWSESIKYFNCVLLAQPDHDEALNHKGVSLYNLGMYEEAISLYNRAIAVNPNYQEAWNNRGWSLKKLGKPEDANYSFHCGEAIAWNNRATFLLIVGRYEEAIEYSIKATRINPGYWQAYNIQGGALHSVKEYEAAVEAFNNAINIKDDNYQVWHNKGLSLACLGQYNEAIRIFDHAITLNPNNAQTWYERGVCQGKLMEYEESIKSYNSAIDIQSDKKEAWNNKGVCLEILGKYEESIKSLNQAIEIKPFSYEAWHNKGISCFKSGKYSESINSYEQVINIQPDQYCSWHNKGLVQFITGDYQSALVTWKQTFHYINDHKVHRYNDVSELIQEFIEELIPRFTQPPIHQTLLIPLLAIYKESNVITELGAALVNTLHFIVAPTISDHTAAQWLALWRTSSLGNEPAMELPLRLMSTAIEYKKDPSKRQRLWLNLPSEERPILDQALKFLD